MIDREKTMKGLECCLVFCHEGYCSKECPYISDGRCYETIKRDALALLKEQEKQLKEWEKNVPFLAAHGILKWEEDDA